MKTINISAKCSDSFFAELSEDDKIKGEYDGYVPGFFPEVHYGDYVILKIDIETGQILNWRAPTEQELEKIFGVS